MSDVRQQVIANGDAKVVGKMLNVTEYVNERWIMFLVTASQHSRLYAISVSYHRDVRPSVLPSVLVLLLNCVKPTQAGVLPTEYSPRC